MGNLEPRVRTSARGEALHIMQCTVYLVLSFEYTKKSVPLCHLCHILIKHIEFDKRNEKSLKTSKFVISYEVQFEREHLLAAATLRLLLIVKTTLYVRQVCHAKVGSLVSEVVYVKLH